MAIAILGSSSSGYTTSTASATSLAVTVSHTQAAGSNRVLLVGINGFWATPVQLSEMSFSVTANGVAMTQVSTTGFNFSAGPVDGQRIALFDLKEASLPSDGTYNIVATLTRAGAANTAQREIGIACVHLSGVDQTTTRRSVVSAVNATPQTATATGAATTVTNDWLVDVLGTYKGTRTDDETLPLATLVDGTDAGDCHMSYEIATGVSTTASWTFTSQEYAHLAVPYIPAAAGTKAPPPPSSRPRFYTSRRRTV